MGFIKNVLKSSVGLKFLMAISGLGMVGFVLGHMLGNLQIFLGQATLNHYGHFLQSLGELLWVIRIGLLALLVVHVISAIKLSRLNAKAKGFQAAKQKTIKSSIASRTMLLSGLVILAFIVYHLLHFTVGAVYSEYYHFYDANGYHDIYHMVIFSFQHFWVALSYIVANALLCLHLWHAVQAMFRSLGWMTPAYRPFLEKLSVGYALVILVGNTSIPLAILMGVIHPII